MKDLVFFLLGGFGFGFRLLFRNFPFTHHYPNGMDLLVIHYRKVVTVLQSTIEFYTDHTAADRGRIFDPNAISGATTPVGNVKVSPPTRYAGIDAQALALQLKPKNRFQSRAIHPAG